MLPDQTTVAENTMQQNFRLPLVVLTSLFFYLGFYHQPERYSYPPSQGGI